MPTEFCLVIEDTGSSSLRLDRLPRPPAPLGQVAMADHADAREAARGADGLPESRAAILPAGAAERALDLCDSERAGGVELDEAIREPDAPVADRLCPADQLPIGAHPVRDGEVANDQLAFVLTDHPGIRDRHAAVSALADELAVRPVAE